MSCSPIISIRNLGKCYRLGATLRHDTIRDHIVHATKGLARRWLRPPTQRDRLPVIGRPSVGTTTSAPITDRRSPVTDRPLQELVSGAERPDEFWALKDVSFDVQQGEVVGIIGRNGAGKSTLLKILSQITEPTTGEIRIRGRVASLLEVGTGFHPELTGRENIFLNGAILGMRRAEIKSKFDEIVAFAEVEKFIDTPVKRYSSGMYVRLAFAVAAHLDPEILVIDEVLAVGDVEFQRKCMGKMELVARGGRTVLFVSHNLAAVRNLCSKVAYIDAGRLHTFAETSSSIVAYLKSQTNQKQTEKNWSPQNGPGTDLLRVTHISVQDANGNAIPPFSTEYSLLVDVSFVLYRTITTNINVGFDLIGPQGETVFRSLQTDLRLAEWPPCVVGDNKFRCTIPAGLLNNGDYGIALRIGVHCVEWIVKSDELLRFNVSLTHGVSPLWLPLKGAADRPGVVSPILPWTKVE